MDDDARRRSTTLDDARRWQTMCCVVENKQRARRMSTAKFLLILGILTTIVYMVAVYYDYDRRLMSRLRTTRSLVDAYAKKPHASSVASPTATDDAASRRRVVLELSCANALVDDTTIRSLLDQSARVDEISVESRVAQPSIDEALRDVVRVHQPQTNVVREVDRRTLVLPVTNGAYYAYDYVESRVRAVA
jgi:hypothetical protein